MTPIGQVGHPSRCLSGSFAQVGGVNRTVGQVGHSDVSSAWGPPCQVGRYALAITHGIMKPGRS